MKYIKWSLLLVLLALIVVLSACAKDGSDIVTTKSEEYPTQETTTAIATMSECITLESLNKYVLVRPDESSQEITDACILLRKEIISHIDTELELKSDLHSDRVASLKIRELEILIGSCDRDETRQFMAEMRRDDYGYALIGKKLVICGGSDAATIKALNAFQNNILKKQEGEVFYDGAVSFLERGTYAVDNLALQGAPIREYEIVYPNRNENAETLAKELSARIAEETGYILPIKADKEPATGKEILVGTTNRTSCSLMTQVLGEGTYVIGAEDNYVCARGFDGMGDYYAVYALMSALFDGAMATHTVTLEAGRVESVPMDETLKAMSFNLWVSSPTPQRMESVRQTIMEYMPDTIGVQEASPTWMDYLGIQLKELYANVGLGRDGGSNGEHSAIFYRRDRFELIETGTKWMSDTPDTVSKFDESSLNRIFTYAILLEKNTNNKIMIVNTHLDHKSETARNKQSTVLMNFLKAYTDYPIILTGDFNATPSSEVYKIVTAQLSDSSAIAQTASKHHTFHSYGSASTYIDYVFVSRQNVFVEDYYVITEMKNGTLPSDHYPLIAEYRVIK